MQPSGGRWWFELKPCPKKDCRLHFINDKSNIMLYDVLIKRNDRDHTETFIWQHAGNKLLSYRFLGVWRNRNKISEDRAKFRRDIEELSKHQMKYWILIIFKSISLKSKRWVSLWTDQIYISYVNYSLLELFNGSLRMIRTSKMHISIL